MKIKCATVLFPLAKGAKSGVGITPLLEEVRCPNTVLIDEPDEELVAHTFQMMCCIGEAAMPSN